MSNNTISWLGTLLPMLSVTDRRIVTTDAFPMHTEVAFYVGENRLVTWTYDVDTCEATRYVTATDDGVDLEATRYTLGTWSGYVAMVTLTDDLGAWARMPV